MLYKKSQQNLLVSLLIFALVFGFLQSKATAQELLPTLPNNFGQPGIIDLPTAKRLPNGELVITQQVHKMLTMTGLTFQALPRVGLTFRYGGQGRGGGYAQGRVNWDRSFDAHISVLMKGHTYHPSQLVFEILLEQVGILLSILLLASRSEISN